MSGHNKVHRATGSSAIASSLTPPAPSGALELVCVKLALSAAGGATEDFSITINSATAAVYDTVIFTQDMSAVADLIWCPETPIPVVNTDVIDFAYTNSNSRDYGLEVIFRGA